MASMSYQTATVGTMRVNRVPTDGLYERAVSQSACRTMFRETQIH